MKVYPDWAAVGDDAQAFVAEVAKRLPTNWTSADNGYAGAHEFRVDASTGLVPSRLILFLKSPQKAYVSNIVPSVQGAPRLSIEQYDEILRSFTDVAEPIARELGLEIERRTADTHIRRWLSPESESRLLAFSKNANKSTGAGHPSDHDRWLDFIIQAHRDQVSCSADILQKFLRDDEGWDDNHAYALAVEYEFARGLLERYDG